MSLIEAYLEMAKMGDVADSDIAEGWEKTPEPEGTLDDQQEKGFVESNQKRTGSRF